MASYALCGSVRPVVCRPARPGRALVQRPVTSLRISVPNALRARHIVKAGDQQVDLTGEWSANWSLASYEDVGEYFNDNLFKDDAAPGSLLQDIMSTDITVATPDTTVADVKAMLTTVTGLPVVASTANRKLEGIVSRKDLERPGSTAGDIMTKPVVACRANSKVADAAVLMLKHKVHRIPIVDEQALVVGIVTRTDIFTALALDTGSTDILNQGST